MDRRSQQYSMNTSHSDEAKADITVKQTRVIRTIHTPALFVQLVHAVVAPNDIRRDQLNVSQ